jgi:pyruvate/2-oxoglutarate dehydrogenase complex dihydrolipoamide acyltransferase (E2) component
MATPVHAPRVNNNDDVVQVVGLRVEKGARVTRGEVIAEVETDKSVSEVEAEHDGYVLAVLCELQDRVPVGSVLLWLGETPDEAVPAGPALVAAPDAAVRVTAEPTAKARAMLAELGLRAEEVPAAGERLTVADVEAYLAGGGARVGVVPPAPAVPAAAPRTAAPVAAGTLEPLGTEDLGMLRTVAWHAAEAVPGYLELEYDHRAWEAHAGEFAQANRLMFSPLLPLLAYRLVQVAKDHRRVNSTLLEGQRYRYTSVNLGFTVQAGETLYMTVVRAAEGLDPIQFIEALGEVQRHATARRLRADEAEGATVAFSSMSRWGVRRHVPILPPYVSLMVAHAAPRADGTGVIGASYDHRVLSGYDVVRVLQALARP